MVNPINYTLGGPDPVGQLMQGIQFGTGLRQAGLQEDAQRQQMELAAAQEARTAEMQPIRMEEAQLGLDAARQGLQQGQLSIEQQRQQLAAADRELARQEAFQSSMTRLAELGPNATFEDYQKVGASFPEFAGAVQESWTGLDSNRQAGVQRRLLQIGAALKGGATDTAVQLAEEYADAAENSGDAASAATARAIAELARTNPNAALASLGLTISAIDPDGAASLFDEKSVRKVDDIGDGSVAVITYADGSREVRDAANNILTGDAARIAMDEAIQRGISEQAGRSGARTEATLTARAQGGEAATAAEARGRTIGAAEAEQEMQAGSALQKAQTSLGLVTALKEDPALESIVGTAQGRLPAGLPLVTGGQPGADAAARLEQLAGNVFLEAFESLKGGGQITQVEGEKAQAAIARLSRIQSYDAFVEALTELEEVYRNAVRRAQAQSGAATPGGGGQVANGVGSDESLSFLQEMQAKRDRGEPFTDEERARIQQIAGGQ